MTSAETDAVRVVESPHTSHMRVGVVGVGRMGAPIARNLLRAGYSTVVSDTDQGRLAQLVEAGAQATKTPGELGAQCDVVFVLVPADREVQEVVAGSDGLLERMSRGSTIIQMSTVHPQTMRHLGSAAEAVGIHMLDAPVTGGPRVAEGLLTIFVGGRPEVLEDHRAVLAVLGNHIHHVGEVGAGQASKLVNNLLSLVNAVVVAEAVVFARQAGLDLRRMYEAIQTGPSDSTVFRWIVPNMLAREFEPELRGKVEIVAKDLSLILKHAEEVHAPLFLAPLAHQLYAATQARGDGDKHYPAVVQIYEELSGAGPLVVQPRNED